MNSNEFTEYKKIFIQEYSEDLSINHGYTVQEGIAIAEDSFSTSFPNNIPEKNNIISCIIVKNNVVGYLWYSINSSSSKAFICDFFILDEERSKGYGKSAIAILESELLRQKIDYLGLRVANNNPRALGLYKSVGFNVSGTNMSKRIGVS